MQRFIDPTSSTKTCGLLLSATQLGSTITLQGLTLRLDSHLSPNETYCGVRNNCKHLRRAKVWGAPTYVLDPKLQDGHTIPKWDSSLVFPRSTLLLSGSFATCKQATLVRNFTLSLTSSSLRLVLTGSRKLLPFCRKIVSRPGLIYVATIP